MSREGVWFEQRVAGLVSCVLSGILGGKKVGHVKLAKSSSRFTGVNPIRAYTDRTSQTTDYVNCYLYIPFICTMAWDNISE